MIGTILTFLAEHYDLIELLYTAITQKSLTKTQAIQAIKDAMVAEADAQMKLELG